MLNLQGAVGATSRPAWGADGRKFVPQACLHDPPHQLDDVKWFDRWSGGIYAGSYMQAREWHDCGLRCCPMCWVFMSSSPVEPCTARGYLPHSDARDSHEGRSQDYYSLMEGLFDTLQRLSNGLLDTPYHLSSAVLSRPLRLNSVDLDDAQSYLDKTELYKSRDHV